MRNVFARGSADYFESGDFFEPSQSSPEWTEIVPSNEVSTPGPNTVLGMVLEIVCPGSGEDSVPGLR